MKKTNAEKNKEKQIVFKSSGFTLVEVLISAAILSIAVIGASSVFLPSIKAIDRNREQIIMKNLAVKRIEEWHAYKYSEIVPGMDFRHFDCTIDPTTRAITFASMTTPVDSEDKVNWSAGAAPILSTGYTITVGGAAGDLTSIASGVLYSGPVAANSPPGKIISTITCPAGICGILSFDIHDIPNVPVGAGFIGREQRFDLNGIPQVFFSSSTFATHEGGPLSHMQDLRQWDTASGSVLLELEQTSNLNVHSPTGVNPNAVLSAIRFTVLNGFTETVNFRSSTYRIESKILSTYGDANLVPGWRINVKIDKLTDFGVVDNRYKPVRMVTTISR